MVTIGTDSAQYTYRYWYGMLSTGIDMERYGRFGYANFEYLKSGNAEF
jgi:hypothetical protein